LAAAGRASGNNLNSGDDTMSTNRLIVLIGGSSTRKSTVARTLQEVLLPEQWLLEPASTVVAPAVANAVFNAVGARVRHMPISPQAVLDAMKNKA